MYIVYVIIMVYFELTGKRGGVLEVLASSQDC